MNRDLWALNLWNWPFATTMEMWRRMLAPEPDENSEREPLWTTPNRVVLELDALRLRDFSTDNAQPPVVVVAPYALHGAQIADLAPGHSLIEALRKNGLHHLFLVEWKSATPATRLNTIDSQLAALNIAVDEIGRPIDLIGLCQGGWLSLLYAARFPSKTRRVVIVGAPIDVRAEVSALTAPVDRTTDVFLDHLTSCDDGIVKGERMASLWPREADEETRLLESLQLKPPFESDQAQAACAAFRRWDRRTVDLPGPYYREVVERIYRENRLASGCFPALGREVAFRSLDRPLFLLAGATDPIAPPAQAMAAAKLVGGAVETALAPCGHLALFMGASTLAHEWREVANWLGKKDDQLK